MNLAMSSRGIQLSGGMGREMANLIIDRTTKSDMSSYDINRFHRDDIKDPNWLKSVTQESHVRTYCVKYPTLQRLAGRNVRLSPLHSRLAEKGAFFGTAGNDAVQCFLFFRLSTFHSKLVFYPIL